MLCTLFTCADASTLLKVAGGCDWSHFSVQNHFHNCHSVCTIFGSMSKNRNFWLTKPRIIADLVKLAHDGGIDFQEAAVIGKTNAAGQIKDILNDRNEHISSQLLVHAYLIS